MASIESVFGIGASIVTHRERILAFLRSIAPADASNSEISSRTGIRPPQTVFATTRDLMRDGLIRGVQDGKEWRFRAANKGVGNARRVTPDQQSKPPAGPPSPTGFERLAREVMSTYFGASLSVGRVPGVPKLFDLVSSDREIVGDAKFYTLVQGERLPSAKFSVIAEHVWLLEKTGARQKFLVFGNEKRVPLAWLDRYGQLAGDVGFYFLDETRKLLSLNAAAERR